MGMSDPCTSDEAHSYKVMAALTGIAADRGVSAAQVAVNYVRGKPGVTSVVIGARNSEQLTDDLAAASWSLSQEEMRRLDEISRRPLPYPYWNQQRFNQDRMCWPEVAVAP